MDLINSAAKIEYDKRTATIRKSRQQIKKNLDSFNIFRQHRIHVKIKKDDVEFELSFVERELEYARYNSPNDCPGIEATLQKLNADLEHLNNQYYSAAKFGKLLLEENAKLYKKIKKLKRKQIRVKKKASTVGPHDSM